MSARSSSAIVKPTSCRTSAPSACKISAMLTPSSIRVMTVRKHGLQSVNVPDARPSGLPAGSRSSGQSCLRLPRHRAAAPNPGDHRQTPTVSRRSCLSFLSAATASGVDVLAAPRNRKTPVELNMAALDALIRMISPRYDLVVVDMRRLGLTGPARSSQHAISPSSLGSTRSPGCVGSSRLFRVQKNEERTPPQIVVALNRCESGLAGGLRAGSM